MDQDGIADVGLWVPDRSGSTDGTTGEWYFLLSNDPATDTSGRAPLPTAGRDRVGLAGHIAGKKYLRESLDRIKIRYKIGALT